MKYILIIILFFFPCLVIADTLPEGCYMSYNSPGECWTPKDGKLSWQQLPDRKLGAVYYGTAVETLIYYGYYYKQTVAQYELEYLSLYEDYLTVMSKNRRLKRRLKYANK